MTDNNPPKQGHLPAATRFHETRDGEPTGVEFIPEKPVPLHEKVHPEHGAYTVTAASADALDPDHRIPENFWHTADNPEEGLDR